MRMCLKSWNRREFQFELLHPNLSWKRLVVYSIHVYCCAQLANSYRLQSPTRMSQMLLIHVRNFLHACGTLAFNHRYYTYRYV